MTKEDLKVGSTYRAKRYRNFSGEMGNNDRTIIWMSDTKLQYDSDTVKIGMHLPTISIEMFLRWAEEKVSK